LITGHDNFEMSVRKGSGKMRYYVIGKIGIYCCLLGALCFLALTGSSCRKSNKQEDDGQKVSKTATKSPGKVTTKETNAAPASKEPSQVNEPAGESQEEKATAVTPRKTSSGFAKVFEEATKHPDTEEYVEESPEQTEEPVKDPLAEWAAAGDTDSKLEVLDKLEFSGVSRDGAISVVGKALDDNDPDVRQNAVEVLEDFEQGANGDPRIVELILRGLADENEDVRFAAMTAAEEQGTEDKLKIYDEAIGSAYDDVKVEAVSELSDMSSPAAMDVLIEGLKDNNAEFREEVSSAIYFLIDEQFDSYSQAEQWWKANRHRFDENLVEKEDAQ
jgi:hypothetical protein